MRCNKKGQNLTYALLTQGTISSQTQPQWQVSRLKFNLAHSHIIYITQHIHQKWKLITIYLSQKMLASMFFITFILITQFWLHIHFLFAMCTSVNQIRNHRLTSHLEFLPPDHLSSTVTRYLISSLQLIIVGVVRESKFTRRGQLELILV